MPLNPEPLWPIVLGQHQDPVPTWARVVFSVVAAIVFLSFIGVVCHLFWTVLWKKRPLRNSGRRGGSGDGGGGGCGGGGCGGGGDGG